MPNNEFSQFGGHELESQPDEFSQFGGTALDVEKAVKPDNKYGFVPDPQPQNEAPGWIARGVSDLTNQMSSMRGSGTPHSPEEMQAMGQNLGGYVKSGEALKDAATYGKTVRVQIEVRIFHSGRTRIK